MSSNFDSYAKDIRDLPLWVKWVGVAFACLAVPGSIYTSLGAYGAVVATFSPEEIATTTVNISDIFYRLNKIDRPIDQRTLLHQYDGTKIVGIGSFETLGGSREDKSYRLYLSVRTGVISKEYIACSFGNVDEATEKQIDLLKNGQKISIVGTFSNSSEFGSNAWVVNECGFLK